MLTTAIIATVVLFVLICAASPVRVRRDQRLDQFHNPSGTSACPSRFLIGAPNVEQVRPHPRKKGSEASNPTTRLPNTIARWSRSQYQASWRRTNLRGGRDASRSRHGGTVRFSHQDAPSQTPERDIPAGQARGCS